MAADKDPMKDALQAELGRETRFIDAVIASAHSKAAEMIHAANRSSENDLAFARAQCGLADRDALEKEYIKNTRRAFAAAELEYKQQLLNFRRQLAEDVFFDVRSRLESFVSSPRYGGWLEDKAAAYTEQMQGEKAVLFVRRQDLNLAGSLQKTLPGCEVRAAADIELGGFRLQQRNRMFDETIDTALEEQKELFTINSRLTL